MTSWSVLIVDDEPLARANLAAALDAHENWWLAGSCANAAEARQFLAGSSVDLLLLDIRMPGESGIELARDLAANPKAPCIAFVTAFDDRAVDAFDVFALDYLLKPFDDARFARLLDRVEAMLAYRGAMSMALQSFAEDHRARLERRALPPIEFVTVRSIGAIERIALSQVEWITSAGNYIELHLADRKVLHRCAMREIEQRLPCPPFLRIHRTAIVRAARIRVLKADANHKHVVEMANGQLLPVSDQYLEAVRRELGR